MIRTDDPLVLGLAAMTNNPPVYIAAKVELDALRLDVSGADLLNAAWTVECVAQDIDAQSGQ